MSKSYDNAIYLSDPPDVVMHKVAQMFTDPKRMRRSDRGNPDTCNVFTLHTLYSTTQDVDMINRECRVAGIGCVECKKKLAETGVKTHRLTTEQLEDLYTSYFMIHNQKGSNEKSEFIGPESWFGMWKDAMEQKED